jgi:hypothetical protein
MFDKRAAYDQAEQDIDDHIDNVVSFIKQPSVSPQNLGVRDAAELLRKTFVAALPITLLLVAPVPSSKAIYEVTKVQWSKGRHFWMRSKPNSVRSHR